MGDEKGGLSAEGQHGEDLRTASILGRPGHMELHLEVEGRIGAAG